MIGRVLAAAAGVAAVAFVVWYLAAVASFGANGGSGGLPLEWWVMILVPACFAVLVIIRAAIGRPRRRVDQRKSSGS